MISKSVSDFHAQLAEYTTELTKRIKRATTQADYGFVRKETRAPTSIRNVVQPSWTGHFWIKEYGLVPVN